jgi:hypothetical protein
MLINVTHRLSGLPGREITQRCTYISKHIHIRRKNTEKPVKGQAHHINPNQGEEHA